MNEKDLYEQLGDLCAALKVSRESEAKAIDVFINYLYHNATADPEAPRKPQPRKSSTPWVQSKKPSIEWCPEQEADPQDVKRAKDPNDKSMWYLEPRPPYDTGSIFRRRP